VVGSKNGGYIGIYEIERDFSINHIDTFKVDPMCTEVASVSISFDRQYLLINSILNEETCFANKGALEEGQPAGEYDYD
jgi:hypothetical protein